LSRIGIWRVQQGATLSATPLETVRSSETERLLENIVVASPDLLQQDLELVGRQLPTSSGPLDLLGIDPDGRLVVFELKRGVLTREAVAQVIDYASDIASMDRGTLVRLIEEHSGRGGIPEITGFIDWYTQEYQGTTEQLSQRPRMVLVGLGVDGRALRMVNFLADTGVPIQLLTFHAFEADGALLLARQVETEPAATPNMQPSGTKEGNRKLLAEYAQSFGIREFFDEVGRFVQQRLSNAYVWPYKTALSFNVADETPEGRPTQRGIASLSPHEQQRGAVRLSFPERALQLGSDLETTLREKLGGVRRESGWRAMEITLRPETWLSMAAVLGPALDLLRSRWEARRQKLAADVIDSPPDSGPIDLDARPTV
jgi:hypothetical protein